MIIAILLLSFAMQLAAAFLAATAPTRSRNQAGWWAATAALVLMAFFRLVVLGRALFEPEFTAAEWSEAVLEATISAVALAAVLSMRRMWREAGKALAGAREREAQRREGEELWRRVFELAPDGYIMLKLDGTLHRVNAAAEEITGLPRGRSEGRHIFELGILDEAGRELATRNIQMLAAGGEPGPGEYAFLRPDGTRRFVEASGFFTEVQGRPMLLSILRDVTRRRQTEDELRRNRMRLEEAQRVAGLVTFETDLVNGTIWASDDPRSGAVSVGGGNLVTLAEAFDFIVPEDRDRVIRAMAASGARGGSGEMTIEYRQVLPSQNEARTVQTVARVQYDDLGEPVRMIGATLDVTDVRRTEQEVRTLNQELEERVRDRTVELKRAVDELEAFSYSVSHDLRSPLRAMAGYSQMVLDQDGSRLTTQSREHLERIRASSVRMAGLIDGLLSLSRLTRRTRNDAPVDLSQLARSLVTELRHTDPTRLVDVRIPDGLVAQADPGMMTMVLQNLLANAWKFTRRSPQARIEFGCDEGGAFFVRDNGVGFDPAQKAKLFRPFERLHRTDEFEGTGIGLATVARIVRHYGGRVWADGEIGKGSTFWFTLAPTSRESA